MYSCLRAYLYVIFCQQTCPLDLLCVDYIFHIYFLLFLSDLSTHQSASEERVKQLREEIKAANTIKISQLEAEIAALECMLLYLEYITCSHCLLYMYGEVVSKNNIILANGAL